MKSTKELARQLGLLRRRATTAQQTRDVRRVKKTSQVFSYLIVIDFESTCWQDRRNTNQEVIEFPAVLLNTSTGAIESEFHFYVLPEEHPQLSAFCTELTGITQDQVESGIPLRVCLSKFSRWLKKLEDDYHIAYNSGDDAKNLCTFVTWSDWDLSVCLHYECRRKQLLKPAVLNSWIDLRATYKNFYQRKPNGLHGALQDIGIEFHGRQHSGLADARNTASLAWRMMCDGCVMKITRTMPGRQQLKRKPTHPPEQPVKSQAKANDEQPMQEPDKLLPNGFRESDTSLVSHTQGICEVSTETDVFCRFDIWEDVLQPRSAHNVIRTRTCSPSDDKMTGNLQSTLCAETSTHAVHEQRAEQTNVAEIGKRNTGNGNLIRSTSINKTCTSKPTSALGSTNYAVKSKLGHVQATSIGFTSVTETPDHFRTVSSTSLARSTPQKNSTSTVSPIQSNTLKTPVINQTSSEFKTPYLPRTYPMPGSTNFKTPTHCDRSRMSTSLSAGKITPPMCQCGRRAKQRTVQSPGPNMDRTFYSCPLGRRSSESGLQDTTNTRKGCRFFKWESAFLAEKQKLFASPVSHNRLQVIQTPANNGKSSGNMAPPVGKRLGIGMRSVLQKQNQVRL